MNRDDLQLFMTILEENNLIKAAEQLYLSPSTAGSRLRAMEEELGYPLFERRKGVKSALPTSRGLAFSHIASQMLALWNEADQIGGMSDSPFLTIATVDSFLDYNLTPFYRELISLHGFSLDIKCYPADMIYSLVSSKQADVGFALYDISTPHVNVTPLSEDDMVLVVPEGSALLSQTYSNANIDMAFSTSCSIASTAALAKSWKYLTSFSSSSFFTAFTPALDI